LEEIKLLKEKPQNFSATSIQSSEKKSENLKSNVNILRDTVIESDFNAKKEKSAVEKLIEINSPNSQQKSTQNLTGKIVSPETFENNWSAFVSEYGTAETGLYILKQKKDINISFFQNEVVLQIKNKFAFENLNKRKTTLSDCLSKFFSTHVAVKVIQTDGANTVSGESVINNSASTTIDDSKNNDLSGKDFQSNTSQSNVPDEENLKNLHPVERVIIEKFNAREIISQ
jgi:hypothetical protein